LGPRFVWENEGVQSSQVVEKNTKKVDGLVFGKGEAEGHGVWGEIQDGCPSHFFQKFGFKKVVFLVIEGH
jgi:hypothetical protein